MHPLVRKMQAFGYEDTGRAWHCLQQFAADKDLQSDEIDTTEATIGEFLDYMAHLPPSDTPGQPRSGADRTASFKHQLHQEVEEIESGSEISNGAVSRHTAPHNQGAQHAAASTSGAGGGGRITSFFPLQIGVSAPAPSIESCPPNGGSTDTSANEHELLMDDIAFANWRVFGNSSFRHRQRLVIDALMQGRNVFVLMPTGGGKSLCYQLPAVVMPGLAVVVSPLISLMQDQVKALCSLPSGGVPATYLNSQQSESERGAVYRELGKDNPTCKLLYITPEQFAKSQLLIEKLTRLYHLGKLSLFCVDEAHCVSTWGHDFRPDYKKIGKVKNDNFPNAPTLALTATATARVQQDIVKLLKLKKHLQVQVSFVRNNLTFRVVNKDNLKDEDEQSLLKWKLIDYIKKHGPNATGIVYCLTQKQTVSVAHMLEDEGGIKACHYHGGMTPGQRIKAQNSWRTGAVQVCVATIAFGMGIDKPDVRFVVHESMSTSLEGYYQEAGRAGRDGRPAECVLLTAPTDAGRIQQLLFGPRGRGSKSRLQGKLELLEQMKAFCQEGRTCRHNLLVAYFGEDYQPGRCGSQCDNCLRTRGQQPHPDWYIEEEGQPLVLPPDERAPLKSAPRKRKSKGSSGAAGSRKSAKAKTNSGSAARPPGSTFVSAATLVNK